MNAPARLNVPNAISLCRLAVVPVMLATAWVGWRQAFLAAFAVALISDSLDGFLARKLRQTTPVGTRLDSLADLAVYMSAPVCAWWLWPHIMRREAPYMILVVASYMLPLLVGLARFGRLPCYHTWGAKISAVLMSIAAILLLGGGPAWPFRLATPVLVISGLEEIAITAVLREWRPNVPSLRHALRGRKALNGLIEEGKREPA